MMNINHSHLHFWKYFDIFLKKNFFGKFRSKFTIHLCWGFVVFFGSLMGFVVFEVTHYLFWEFSLLFFTCWVFCWTIFFHFCIFLPNFLVFLLLSLLFFCCSWSSLCCFVRVELLGGLFFWIFLGIFWYFLLFFTCWVTFMVHVGYFLGHWCIFG